LKQIPVITCFAAGGYTSGAMAHVRAAIALKSAKGAWCKRWRLVSLDGSTFDVAEEVEASVAFHKFIGT